MSDVDLEVEKANAMLPLYVDVEADAADVKLRARGEKLWFLFSDAGERSLPGAMSFELKRIALQTLRDGKFTFTLETDDGAVHYVRASGFRIKTSPGVVFTP